MQPKIGVIGNGFVGNAIVRGFLLHSDLKVYDKFQTGSDSLQDTIENSDYIFLCLPTPMKKIDGGEIDLSIIDNTLEAIYPLVANTKKILTIKSTVVPGTTKKYAEKYDKARFCFCPEFLTARASYLDFINAARHIFGGPEDVTKELEEVVFKPRFPAGHFYRTDYTSAEMVKYFANLFFACKVTFCNEFYGIIEKLGLDYNEIKTMVLADGRIGNSHMDVPGNDGDMGFGGTCFPKDINAMIYFCKELGVPTDMLETSWKVNKRVRTNWDWAKSKSAVSTPEK